MGPARNQDSEPAFTACHARSRHQSLLITLVILAIAVYLVIWVLEMIGIALPPKVVQLLWVLVVLVAILLIVRAIGPEFGIRLGGRALTVQPS